VEGLLCHSYLHILANWVGEDIESVVADVAAAVDCTAADLFDPPVAFVVSMDSAVVVDVAVMVVLVLLVEDIVVAKMALLEEKARPYLLKYSCHPLHPNFVATVAMELVAIAHMDCCVAVPAAAVDAAVAEDIAVVATDAAAESAFSNHYHAADAAASDPAHRPAVHPPRDRRRRPRNRRLPGTITLFRDGVDDNNDDSAPPNVVRRRP